MSDQHTNTPEPTTPEAAAPPAVAARPSGLAAHWHGLRSGLGSQASRYGGYASVITFVAVVVAVLVNLIVQRIDVQIDLTPSGIYTLSEQSEQVAREVTQDVTFFVLAPPGAEPELVMPVLTNFRRLNSRISIETIDADENPGFVARFAEEGRQLRNGSIIVAGESFHKVLAIDDIYSISYQNPNNPQVMGLTVEKAITAALVFVATGSTPTIYELTGLGGTLLADLRFDSQVEQENFALAQINLIQDTEVPADAAMLLVMEPRRDLTPPEAEKIKRYLENGGRAFFLIDYEVETLIVFNELLASFGVRLERGIVFEGDQNFHTGSPLQLVPQQGDHPIVQPLTEQRVPVVAAFAQAIQPVDLVRRDLLVVPLLTTSPTAFLRTDLAQSSANRMAGDVGGPFMVAAAISPRHEAAGERHSRIVVASTAMFLQWVQPYGIFSGSVDFFMNAVSWLEQREDTLSIRPKSLIQFPMQLTGAVVLVIAGIIVVLIPVGIFAGGLVVWLRRRHL